MSNDGSRIGKLVEDITEDEGKLDAMAAKLESSFDATFGNDEFNDDDPEQELLDDADAPEEEEAPEAEAEEEGDDPEADAADPEPKKEADAPVDDDTVQIPDNLIRSALHNEWSMDDLREMYAANPALTLKTLQKQYDDNNNLTKAFSDIGRKNREVVTPAVPAAPAGKKRIELKLPSAEQLKRDYPNDALIDDQVIPMQRQMEEMASVINELSDRTGSITQDAEVAVNNAVQTADQRLLQIEINSFFENDTMSQFAPIYGTRKMGERTWDALTPDQRNNRMEVCQMAEDIFFGAQTYGRPITEEQALLKAHLVTTDEYRSQIIREDLMANTKKRSKSLQLKPSQGKRTKVDNSENGKPGTQTEFEAKVKNKMRTVLGK